MNAKLKTSFVTLFAPCYRREGASITVCHALARNRLPCYMLQHYFAMPDFGLRGAAMGRPFTDRPCPNENAPCGAGDQHPPLARCLPQQTLLPIFGPMSRSSRENLAATFCRDQAISLVSESWWLHTAHLYFVMLSPSCRTHCRGGAGVCVSEGRPPSHAALPSTSYSGQAPERAHRNPMATIWKAPDPLQRPVSVFAANRYDDKVQFSRHSSSV